MSTRKLADIKKKYAVIRVSQAQQKEKSIRYAQLVNTSTGNDMVIAEDLMELAVDGLKYIDALEIIKDLMTIVDDVDEALNGMLSRRE